jgi:hypothetical protein
VRVVARCTPSVCSLFFDVVDPCAEERRTTLLRFLLEASQSSDGIKLLTPPRDIADRVIRLCLNVSSSSSADEFSTGNPVKDALAAAIASLTGSIKEGDGAGGLVDRRKLEARRRKYAQTLAEVTGKPLRLCELGLEMNGDNPDATMVWLDSPAAARFIEDVEDDIDDPSTPAVVRWLFCRLHVLGFVIVLRLCPFGRAGLPLGVCVVYLPQRSIRHEVLTVWHREARPIHSCWQWIPWCRW